MNAIDAAIYSKGTGNATLMAAISGFYHGRTTEGKAYPLASFFNVTAIPEYFFGGTALEDCRYQMDIYVASDNAQTFDWTTAGSIYDKLTAVFDNCSLTITGHTHVMMKRINREEIEEVEDGRNLARIMVEYKLMTQH